MEFRENTLYYGDCLEVMADWSDDCIDLIYLDPPFNSNSNYNILYGSSASRRAQVLAFADTWKWDGTAVKRVEQLENALAHPANRAIKGLRVLLDKTGMLAYLSYMAERLTIMHRLLKPTGSIYLHCDPTASHYLKVLMDNIFGAKNFIDEIVWNYGTPSGGRVSGKKPVKTHEILLVYAKKYGDHTYNRQYTPYSERYVRDWFRHRDPEGRKFRTRSRKGKIIRQYLDESPGVPLSITWSDIMQLYGSAGWFPNTNKEHLGYPTQKPVALLERILMASSNEGDIVLDPFCGCGTTIAAASKLERQWLGIDISPFAIKLIVRRRFENEKIETSGFPVDMEGAIELARAKPFDFEKWAIDCISGMVPNNNQRGDGGVDGRGTLILKPDQYSDLVLAQVKGGNYSIGQLRDFLHTLEREKAALGIFITLYSLRERQRQNAEAELGTAGSLELGASTWPRVQLWSIEDFFDGHLPQLPALADPFTGKEPPAQPVSRLL